MIWAAPYNGDEEGPKAMVLLIRKRGQRWHGLVCFGRCGHYYEDGWCEHTDEIFYHQLTDRGRQVTKVEPFGNGKYKPKRFAKRPIAA